MPIDVPSSFPTLFIRKAAFERIGLSRATLDTRFNLTNDEFRIEGELIAIGPLPNDEMVSAMIEEIENAGAVYFDEFFELSGNWPDWLRLYAMAPR